MQEQNQTKSLAQFVSERRENIGLSQIGLAKRANLKLEIIEGIEGSKELFLAPTIRQKLAKGLKVEPYEIKKYEKSIDIEFSPSPEYVDEIKALILEDEEALLLCPVCKSRLITRVARMYDLEDNLVLHPKARCTKCPFQIK